MNLEDILSPQFPQSKFYLKIIGIPYLIENTNTLINSSVLEIIIKNLHIFNNVTFASKLRIIKVSHILDMAII